MIIVVKTKTNRKFNISHAWIVIECVEDEPKAYAFPDKETAISWIDHYGCREFCTLSCVSLANPNSRMEVDLEDY